MSRTPNDDRSDSKNPNNSAYWASEANHRHQTGGDDDDYDDRQSYWTSHGVAVVSSGAPAPLVKEQPERVVSVSCEFARSGVRDLHLVFVPEKGHKERNIRVDSPSIDEAIRDALVLWEGGGIAFMALYDRQSVYLEKLRENRFSADITRELASLGELQQLARIADEHLHSARRSLDKCMGKSDSHGVATTIREIGAWKAARDALHDEVAQKISGLNDRNIEIDEETLQDLSHAAKLALQAEASAGLVRDFQQGKTKADPLVGAFWRPEKIGSIRL
jgi:hypothetical protein